MVLQTYIVTIRASTIRTAARCTATRCTATRGMFAVGRRIATCRTVARSILFLAGSLLCLLDVDRLGTLLLSLQCGTLYCTGCYLYKLHILEYRIEFRTWSILDVDTLDMSVALEISGTVSTITDNLQTELAQVAKLHLVTTLKLQYQILYRTYQYCGDICVGNRGLHRNHLRELLERSLLVHLGTGIKLTLTCILSKLRNVLYQTVTN